MFGSKHRKKMQVVWAVLVFLTALSMIILYAAPLLSP